MAHQIRRNLGDIIFDTVVTAGLILTSVTVAYPIFFVLIASMSDPFAINLGEVLFWPVRINFDAYIQLWGNKDIWTGYSNSLFYTFFGTLINLFVTLTAAYALSRKTLIGKKVIMVIFIFTMYFSGGLIPHYMLVKSLGMINTVWVLLLPGAISIYNFLIARAFFASTISDSMIESSMIDGASHARTFLSIVLPLSPAIIAVMTLYYALGHWNSYFAAMIYISDKKLQTLQVLIKQMMAIISESEMESLSIDQITEIIRAKELMKYAVVVVSSLPVLLLYPFIQKYFIKGVMIGAVKG